MLTNTNKNLHFVIVGISHKKTPLALREKFSFNAESLSMYYSALKQCSGAKEVFILSTCNRVELYAVGYDAHVLISRLKSFLCGVHNMGVDSLKDCVYVKRDSDAVVHLVRVASGLDSMVIGEQQIVGQIKKAYSQACVSECIGPYLHRVIQHCLRVSKKARTLTALSRGVTSISGVAVELIKKESDLSNKKVLVVGAGKAGTMTVVKLANLPMREIIVTNRDITRAKALKKLANVRVADIGRLAQEISAADIVITAIAGPECFLRPDIIGVALRSRQRKLLLIDLGVPRNIEESVQGIPNVQLYNIEDLAPVIEEAIHNRLIEAAKAEEIIKGEMTAFDGLYAADVFEWPSPQTRSPKGTLCAQLLSAQEKAG